MLPEVQEFFTARDAARAASNDTHRMVENEYGLGHISYQIRSERIEALHVTRATAIDAAWATLKETTGDPMVKFIVGNPIAKRYPEQAQTLLKALPLDHAGLCQLGREHDWCEVFDAFLDEAIAAGAVTGDSLPKPLSPATRELTSWFNNEITSSRLSRHELLEYVDKIVAEALGAAVPAPADAVNE
jgi:hypothetical protein